MLVPFNSLDPFDRSEHRSGFHTDEKQIPRCALDDYSSPFASRFSVSASVMNSLDSFDCRR